MQVLPVDDGAKSLQLFISYHLSVCLSVWLFLLLSYLKMSWIKSLSHTILSLHIVFLCLCLQRWNLCGRKLEGKNKRGKSGGSKSLHSTWILLGTSVVSPKLYLCAYSLSALLHCQSCIFYCHLIHGRESDVASTLQRHACLPSLCLYMPCLTLSLFNALLSCPFSNFQIYSIVSVPPTTVKVVKLKVLFFLSFSTYSCSFFQWGQKVFIACQLLIV